jgi:hypothetical protein
MYENNRQVDQAADNNMPLCAKVRYITDFNSHQIISITNNSY